MNESKWKSSIGNNKNILNSSVQRLIASNNLFFRAAPAIEGAQEETVVKGSLALQDHLHPPLHTDQVKEKWCYVKWFQEIFDTSLHEYALIYYIIQSLELLTLHTLPYPPKGQVTYVKTRK